jgi:hypothetical protein
MIEVAMPPNDIDPNINVQILRCRTWDRALESLTGLRGNYIFRGQGEDWPLETRLDRACRSNFASEIENTLLATFKAAAHLYQQNLPAADDDLSWLALMQHHGVPTRLLDWTASPLIAAFFAAEHCPQNHSNRNFVLWALDLAWLREKARIICRLESELTLSHPQMFSSSVLGKPGFFVAPVQPRWLNARQVQQKGLFLCVGNPHQNFQYNLSSMQREVEVKYASSLGYKIIIPGSQRLKALSCLERLGISRVTLFPGLDGFAQSLTTQIRLCQDDSYGAQWNWNALGRFKEFGFF